jgi:orotate phosphoribosyltransferase
MTSAETILSIFRETGGLLEGHFQLTSGLHSSTYFQCAKVLQHPRHAEFLCGILAAHFRNRPVDVVIAPAMGGIVVSQEVGRQLGVRSIFAERSDGMMQIRRGFSIGRGERVLVCEDVITTGGSVKEVIDIVAQNGGALAGVGAIVDRSGGRSGLPDFLATITLEVTTYRPADCPLCNAGQPVVKPGSRPQNLPGSGPQA